MKKSQLAKLLEPRRPKYKRVKMLMPHCPVCGEILMGDNSWLLPWRCSCGVWEWDSMNEGYYKIKTKVKAL